MAGASTSLEALGISKRFDGRCILEQVSVRLEAGEVVGLLGPNGAGKSTLLRVMMGLLRPDAGRVLLDGVEISHWPTYRRARAGLGYLPQEPSAFLGLTGQQNLEAVLELRDRARAEAAPLLEALGLSARRHQPAGTLSGGEQRRLEIARLLAVRPRLLLLDEPLRGLDQAARKIVREKIEQLVSEGCGVLLTDHQSAGGEESVGEPSEGEGVRAKRGKDGKRGVGGALGVCQRLYVLAEGRLVASGSAEEAARCMVSSRPHDETDSRGVSTWHSR